MVTSTWGPRELPVLMDIAEHQQASLKGATSMDIAQRTGLPHAEVVESLHALMEAEYVRGTPMSGPERYVAGVSLLERGRRETGLWPKEEVASAFMTALDGEIAATTDPVEKSRLEQVRDGLLDVGKSVLTRVLTDMATTGRLPGT